MLDLSVAFDRPAAGGTAAEALLVSPPQMLEMLPLAAYACDATGRLRWFNALAAQLWGRSPRIGDDTERFCGSPRLYALDGSQLPREETPMAQVLRTGTPVSGCETSVERSDGTRIVVMVHINPIKDDAGNVIGAINCFHDVTAAAREARRQRASERYFREVLEALPVAIYTTDAAGRITFYNEAAVELSGRRPEIGADEWCVTWRLYRPDGTPLPHDECPMAVALREDRPVRGAEAIAERPDGARVPFIPYPTPLHDATGNLIGAVNALVDIAHRKEAETQQRVLFAELNHRMKNNMQMLHGLLKAAQRDMQSAEARDAINDAVHRIGALAAAQKVLYQANNASGYSTTEFIASVCASARQAFPSAVQIHCDAIAAELSNDTAAPLALILNELITNAAKHGSTGRGEDGRGEVAIRVRLTKESDLFTLQVEDDGSGFDLSTARHRSSGLGLVQGLVGQIGGRFYVERTPGARCTVEFRDDPPGSSG